MEEKILCEREVSNKPSLRWVYIGLGYIVFSFVMNFIMGIVMNGYIFACFEYGGLYFIGFGNAFLGAFVALIAFIIWLNGRNKGEVVLTNKRVIVRYTLKKLFAGEIILEKNYILNHIVDFSVNEYKKRGSFSFSLSTQREKIRLFISDREFYNCFVEAIK